MNADTQALDYDTAVTLADTALAIVLQRLQLADGTYPRALSSGVILAGTEFSNWLTVERPDVLDAFEASGDYFEPVMFEDYIERHSRAFALTDTHHNPDDPLPIVRA